MLSEEERFLSLDELGFIFLGFFRAEEGGGGNEELYDGMKPMGRGGVTVSLRSFHYRAALMKGAVMDVLDLATSSGCLLYTSPSPRD